MGGAMQVCQGAVATWGGAMHVWVPQVAFTEKLFGTMLHTGA